MFPFKIIFYEQHLIKLNNTMQKVNKKRPIAKYFSIFIKCVFKQLRRQKKHTLNNFELKLFTTQGYGYLM
jgi:hypothetical protein